jgi:hypothetical protein
MALAITSQETSANMEFIAYPLPGIQRKITHEMGITKYIWETV